MTAASATGIRTILNQHLIGQTDAMELVRQLVMQVAAKPATVLILGETGTGKEVVARCLHQCSQRSGKPLIPVNCGAIPGDLLESELFGHEKGAFTGAVTARKGRFEMAEGGTLFLDEIGDMPLPMQVKLLRVLQERAFERVGSGRQQTCDVRVIAATHQHLEERVASGEFREDLFYRLNVFPIEMPPLRERAADIPLLTDRFIALSEKVGQPGPRLMPSAVTALQAHHWPGNVRELANLIERLAILSPNAAVSAEDLPPRYRRTEDQFTSAEAPHAPDSEAPIQEDLTDLFAPPSTPFAHDQTIQQSDPWRPDWPIDLKQYLADEEKTLIEQALTDAEGVIAQAAKYLGLQRTTLVEKLRKYKIQRP